MNNIFYLAGCLPGYERQYVGSGIYSCSLCAVNTYNPNEDDSTSCHTCSSSKTTGSLNGQASCLGRFTFQAKLTPRLKCSTPAVHWQCLAVQYFSALQDLWSANAVSTLLYRCVGAVFTTLQWEKWSTIYFKRSVCTEVCTSVHSTLIWAGMIRCSQAIWPDCIIINVLNC